MEARFELDCSQREALSAERAEQLLASVSAGITWIKLSGKSFGDGSATIAAEALARAAPTLRHVDLSDIIAARPEDEAKRALVAIAEGLAEAKELVSIDLSDNALGAKGIRAIGDILSGQTALKSLKLCNNGLAADAGEIIAANLTKVSPTKLRLLHFHNNLLENAGAKALAPIVEASPELEDFRFTGLRVHHDGAVRISQALKVNAPSLRKLNLADNNFGSPGAVALGAALSKTKILEELILRDTALGDEGVLAVMKGLRNVASHIRVLDLSGNDMTVESSRALKRTLSNMPSLESLVLEDNELGSAGAKQIAAGLLDDVHRNLVIVNASGSEIGSSGAVALSRAVARLPKMTHLNLNGNSIRAEVVTEIQELLHEKFGSVSDNDDDEDDEERFSDDESESQDENEDEDAADSSDDARDNLEKHGEMENVNSVLDGKLNSDKPDLRKGPDDASTNQAVTSNAVDGLAEAVDGLAEAVDTLSVSS